MKAVIYARVSTEDKGQDPETQLHALREFCMKAEWDIIAEYVDFARAKDYKRRVKWAQLLKDARQHNFKTVLVFRLDRAFRSVRECVNTVSDWFDRGITFKSLREDVIDTTTSQGRFILHIMAAVAELESAIIGERVAAGMARARAGGKQMGRKPLGINLSDVIETLSNEVSISAAAKVLNCSRRQINRMCDDNGLCAMQLVGK